MSRMKNGLVFLVITLAVCGIASMFGVVASQDWVQRADASGVGKVVLGMPVDWELNFPYAGTPFGRDLFRFHNLLFSVDLAICSLVAILLFIRSGVSENRGTPCHPIGRITPPRAPMDCASGPRPRGHRRTLV